MLCAVCGQPDEINHDCKEIVPWGVEQDPPPASGLAIGYFLKQAIKIIRWDDAAVYRAVHDTRAFYAGILCWLIGQLFPVIAGTAIAVSNGGRFYPALFFKFVAIFLPFAAVYDFVRYGICHLIAKLFFGAKASFSALIRPILLGSLVATLAVVPVVGLFLAGAGTIAIVMLVFEEVDHIERMQAFMISAAVNIAALIGFVMLVPRLLSI
jgi:hypothetical protein